MARIQRHSARRTEIHISQTQHHVTRIKHNVSHGVAAVEAVHTLDEVDIVRQPRRSTANCFLIALHSAQRSRVFERHRQVQDASGHTQRFYIGEMLFCVDQFAK